MKKIILLSLILAILPFNNTLGVITNIGKIERDFNDTFISSNKIDFKFTNAIWDKIGKRIISRKDFSATTFPISQNISLCNAVELKTELNLDISSRLTCSKLGNDVYIGGFLPRNSSTKLYEGKIYYYNSIEPNFKPVLISDNNSFNDKSLGDLLIGAKPNKELLVVYILNSGRDTTIWTRTGGIWRQLLDTPPSNSSFKKTTKIVWSGRNWFMSSFIKNLQYLENGNLIDVYKQIPNLDFGITNLFGNADNTFVIVGTNKAIKITDNGYSAISTVESKEIRSSKEINEAIIKKSVLNTPSGTSIKFFLSNDNGINYYTFNIGSIGRFISDNKSMRWKAELFSNGNSTPEIKEIGITYISNGTSLQDMDLRDKKRISALKKAVKTLSQYHKDFSAYPVNIFNTNPDKSWAQFINIINIAEDQKRKNYSDIPEQPITEAEDFKYHIKTDAIGKDYVLWTKLENKNSKLLAEDNNGEILGINCDNFVYCLTSVKKVIIAPMPAPAKKEEKTIKKTDTVKKETVYIKKTESRAKNIELDLIPGSLIREKGKTNVYFITPQRFKKHILNEEILNSYEGNQDKEIQVVDKKTIKKYPDVKLIKVKDQSEIYFLEKGKKRLIQNNDIFDARGFKQADIVIINEFELDAYQNGNDLSLKKSNSFKRIIEFFTSLLGN
ncbi:MAG: hypothetical protein AAB593_00730 [Patescibacteria group bacterium]